MSISRRSGSVSFVVTYRPGVEVDQPRVAPRPDHVAALSAGRLWPGPQSGPVATWSIRLPSSALTWRIPGRWRSEDATRVRAHASWSRRTSDTRPAVPQRLDGHSPAGKSRPVASERWNREQASLDYEPIWSGQPGRSLDGAACQVTRSIEPRVHSTARWPPRPQPGERWRVSMPLAVDVIFQIEQLT